MKSLCISEVFLLLSVVELEASTSISELSCLKRNLTVTVDNYLSLYFDGIAIADLRNADNFEQPDVVELSCTTQLLAIHGRNLNLGAGILASTDDDYVLTNSSWKCSTVSHVGWEKIDFDDSDWMPAVELIRSPLPGISPHAVWIWLKPFIPHVQESDRVAYCRKRLAPSNCLSNPCSFGGTCMDVPNDEYRCICAPGYTGQNCSSAASAVNSSVYFVILSAFFGISLLANMVLSAMWVLKLRREKAQQEEGSIDEGQRGIDSQMQADDVSLDDEPINPAEYEYP